MKGDVRPGSPIPPAWKPSEREWAGRVNTENTASSGTVAGLCFCWKGPHRAVNAAGILSKCQSLIQPIYSSLRTVCPKVSNTQFAREITLLVPEALQSQPLPALGQIRGPVLAKEEEEEAVLEDSARLRECFCLGAEGAVRREGCSDSACLLPTAHRRPAEGTGAPAAVQAGM